MRSVDAVTVYSGIWWYMLGPVSTQVLGSTLGCLDRSLEMALATESDLLIGSYVVTLPKYHG